MLSFLKHNVTRVWIAAGVLAVLALILSTFYFLPRSAPNGMGSLTPFSDYQYTQTYSDETYHFSFNYPEGFTVTAVSDMGGEGGKTILLESDDKKVGIQILISPYGSDVDITEAMIESDIPDMRVSDPQTVEIGSSRKGLAFMSNNPAFSGASREVWFTSGGYLYQISTYAEFDELLKKLFGTWTFFEN